ncbi:hypothetical protein KJ707_00040 [Patescibacteria group bacterium]|nr:hypothetical protein [Patescibacteria group bacterium]
MNLKRLLLVNKKSVAVIIAGALLMGVAVMADQSRAVSLTSVSATLSNPRLSFRGALTSGNTTGSSIVIINTTANSYPSTSSAQLVEGDVLRIGSAGGLGSYTMASTSSLSTFSITTGLSAGHADVGDDVISSQSAAQTVRFTTANAIANGRFRILVPALVNDAASSDGIPDGGFFDLGASAPTVTCPSNANATYDFFSVAQGNNGDATASAQTINGLDYHVFECAYSGTGAVGTPFDGTTNGAITVTSLINPAPVTNHTTGVADKHNIIVQHLNSSLVVQDTTTVGIGVIEAVKVTASVPAQITFKIIGVAKATTACGVSTNVMTTAATVPFGDVPLDVFTNAAQTLTVSTNAVNGYSVTTIANDQLGRNGGACAGDPTATGNTSCIPDSRGDNTTMSHTAFDKWDANATKGFAYSLFDSDNSINNGSAEAFNYNIGSGSCTGASYCAKQFADTEGSQVAQQIFGSNTVADNENLFVCYRVIPATVTAAGNYENFITYTATATF